MYIYGVVGCRYLPDGMDFRVDKYRPDAGQASPLEADVIPTSTSGQFRGFRGYQSVFDRYPHRFFGTRVHLPQHHSRFSVF